MSNRIPHLSASLIEVIVSQALIEDHVENDVTTSVIESEQLQGMAQLVTQEEGIISGLSVAEATFKLLDETATWQTFVEDGEQVQQNTLLATVTGNASSILRGERIALNFLQHLSGIASLTNQFVQLAKDEFTILDTRKTTPGLRDFQKYAVVCGGGVNHRRDLSSMAMLKDNHRAALNVLGISLAQTVQTIRSANPEILVEIEVDDFSQLGETIAANPDWILLDNMAATKTKHCVELINGRAKIEVSGGINLQNLSTFLDTGINAVSIGALTHSFRSLDISLELTFTALNL